MESDVMLGLGPFRWRVK